jgi:polygalacturonase
MIVGMKARACLAAILVLPSACGGSSSPASGQMDGGETPDATTDGPARNGDATGSRHDASHREGAVAEDGSSASETSTCIPPKSDNPADSGHAAAATSLSLPAMVKTGGHERDALVIAGYLDVTLYGADPTGHNDSTSAFQNALIDAAGDATTLVGTSMAVYVPPGTYLIKNTITGYQGCNSNGSVPTNEGYGSISRYGGVSAPVLVGPASATALTRPTIVLQDGTFTDASHPEPMIHMVNSPSPAGGASACGNQWTGSSAVGAFDILFDAVVRDLNVTTGKNAGAIGVQFYSAQGSYMQNVTVNAAGGYIGLEGAPATELWTNVEVDGGQYGVWVDQTAGVSAIAGLTLENQSVSGVYFDAVGDLSISGFHIDETMNSTATGITLLARIAQGNTLSLLDGFIATTSTTEAAVSNADGISVYMNDVYVRAPKTIITNGGGSSVAASGQTQLVSEYAHADQNMNPNAAAPSNPGYALSCLTYIDDAKQPGADHGPSFGASGAVPGDLVIRHVPGQMPWAFDDNVVWVTDVNPPADPTGFTDSTAQIQAAIEAAHTNGSDEVFLPRGDYSISGTLKLHPNTKFFGVPGLFSRMFGYGWVTHHTLEPYIQVGDATADPTGTAAGRAVVSDIQFGLPSDTTSYAGYAKLLPDAGAGYDPADQTYLYVIDWQTGRSSVSNQLSVGFQDVGNVTTTSPAPAGDVLITAATRNIIQVDPSGGGRWYGLQVAGGGFNSNAGDTFFATGTSAPLSIYGSNIEHAPGNSFYGFSHASNIRVLGSKTESGSAPYWFSIDTSSNVMLSGLTAHQNSEVFVHDPTNVNLNALTFYGVEPAEGSGLAFVKDDTASYSYLNAYDLFKWGDFSNAAFPYCGDHVCDGGETAQNCPGDCKACP